MMTNSSFSFFCNLLFIFLFLNLLLFVSEIIMIIHDRYLHYCFYYILLALCVWILVFLHDPAASSFVVPS